MRVAIVENTRITHHGQVGVALHEQAARIDLFKPWTDGTLPDLGAHDALIVFGGEQSAQDDALHPYLPALADLMAKTAAMDIAVLGICLGAQVFARGLGATNKIGTAPEFGWCDVSVLSQAANDPVLQSLPQDFPIFQWHSDTFTLPPETVHLARSETAAVQCFRTGRAGYGMQFHFEAHRAMVADWAREFPDLIERVQPGWAKAQPTLANTRGALADQHGLNIARAWVNLI
ncbi:MAG: type 1 glutamine amidotransferase [Microgenomates group bacterium]